MALVRKSFHEIPSDAVVLTEDEALSYQHKVLQNWKKPLDVLGYRFGPHVLGAASLFTGIFLNSYYRQKFKLLHYGRVATYLPVSFLPTAFSIITHLEFVQRDVVLQKRDACPVCLEMRASAIQGLVGCVFPAILAPVANLSMAHRYVTCNLPDPVREPRKLLGFLITKTAPISNILFGLFIAHALLGTAVTYFEAHSVINVNTKLALLEEQLESENM